MRRPKLAVLASGRGTNLQAILNASRRRRLPARVAVVVSDNARALALERARAAGVPAVFIDPAGRPSRAAFDRALDRVLRSFGVRWVILAGFMRILTPGFIRRYRGRVLNIHPALLPAFPGARGVRDALRHGVKVTGVTVHFADERVDHGPIILQAALPVRDGETESSLTSRIHRLEHRLYPEAIRLAVSGRLTIKGREVLIRK